MGSKPPLERYIKACKRCLDDPDFLDGVLDILERRNEACAARREKGLFKHIRRWIGQRVEP